MKNKFLFYAIIVLLMTVFAGEMKVCEAKADEISTLPVNLEFVEEWPEIILDMDG